MTARPGSKAAFWIVETTWPHSQGRAARKAARLLVERGLAPCVNILPNVASTYRWKGKVEQAAELLVTCKTTARRVRSVAAWIRSHHPYDVPYVAAFRLTLRSPRYAAWLEKGARLVSRTRPAARPR